jgi:tetratricopeptide (TPR) repeat protein
MGRLSMILVTALALAGTAQADSTEAKKHYDRGMRAYNLQDFRGALTEFQRAYVEMPDAAFLFNIGQAQRQLGQYDAASKSFHLYLANQPDAANRDQVEHLIQQMDKAAADARTKEPTPIAAHPPASPPVAAPAPPPSTDAATIVARPRRPWYRKPAGMAVTGVGVAGAIVGAALLGVAGSDANAARHASTLPNQRQLNNDAGTFGTVGGVTLGVGGALMLAGVIVLAVQR